MGRELLVALVGVGMFLLAVYGWILNIVALCAMSGFSGLLAARVVGIFVFPVGSLLGFFA